MYNECNFLVSKHEIILDELTFYWNQSFKYENNNSFGV